LQLQGQMYGGQQKHAVTVPPRLQPKDVLSPRTFAFVGGLSGAVDVILCKSTLDLPNALCPSTGLDSTLGAQTIWNAF